MPRRNRVSTGSITPLLASARPLQRDRAGQGLRHLQGGWRGRGLEGKGLEGKGRGCSERDAAKEEPAEALPVPGSWQRGDAHLHASISVTVSLCWWQDASGRTWRIPGQRGGLGQRWDPPGAVVLLLEELTPPRKAPAGQPLIAQCPGTREEKAAGILGAHRPGDRVLSSRLSGGRPPLPTVKAA